MSKTHRYSGLTLLELLILLCIGGCLILMVFPAILSVREASRREICSKNMQTIGVALNQYFDGHKEFPPSSYVTRDDQGNITAVDGWSWIALILPQLDAGSSENKTKSVNKIFYTKLDLERGRPLVEPAETQGTPHADALATSIDTLLCPSSGCYPYADPGTRKEAITNYKALGATHFESLSIASPHPQKPKYNAGFSFEKDSDWLSHAKAYHPDGFFHPGGTVKLQDCHHGTAYTLLVVESIEQKFSRWTVGAEATVVGFPSNIEFESTDIYDSRRCVPKGYNDAMTNNQNAEKTYWAYQTFLDWDYENNPYDGKDGSLGGNYGPGSNHSGIVNHLFVAGHVRGIKKDIDTSLYMYLLAYRAKY